MTKVWKRSLAAPARSASGRIDEQGRDEKGGEDVPHPVEAEPLAAFVADDVANLLRNGRVRIGRENLRRSQRGLGYILHQNDSYRRKILHRMVWVLSNYLSGTDVLLGYQQLLKSRIIPDGIPTEKKLPESIVTSSGHGRVSRGVMPRAFSIAGGSNTFPPLITVEILRRSRISFVGSPSTKTMSAKSLPAARYRGLCSLP